MVKDSAFSSIGKGHTPLDQGKKNISALFKANEDIITAQTLMSEIYLDYDSDEYLLPSQNKFFQTFKEKLYLCSKSKNKKLRLKLATTFVITAVKECTLVYNDRSGKTPVKYYLLTLKNSNGKIESDIEISNNSKSDLKQFQTALNENSNGFLINMTEQEFKAFVEEFILPKNCIKVTIYSNAGLISNDEILYKNALAKQGKIIWADKDGFVKIDEKSYVKLAEAEHPLPTLHKCEKTGVQIAKELMQNIKETWSDNIVPAMLALGHIVMSVYYNNFIKRYGAPTLILYGESGTGKSTLMLVGLSIFGLSKDGITSGGSTTRSTEYFASKWNCFHLGVDDISGDTLVSKYFITFIKGIYNGNARARIGSSRMAECLHINSPISYTTNEGLPDLREFINRLNVIEIFGNKFKANKFKYHEFNKENPNNLKELSLILPEFLQYDVESVISIYDEIFATLQANVKDTQNRIIHNVAYAYTGALLLSLISDVEFENLEEQVIEYAKNQVKQYDDIQTPVEKVLSAIITLTDLHQLEEGTHFKIIDTEVNGIPETHIRFNKDVILSAINKYYSYDKSMKIDRYSFLRYAKANNRFRGNNHAVRYDDDKNKVISSICFNISGMFDFVHITKHGVLPMETSVLKPVSADEFRANLEKVGNNM